MQIIRAFHLKWCARNFILITCLWCLSLFISFSANAQFAGQCGELFNDTSSKSQVFDKSLQTLKAPAKAVWNQITYMEMPLAISHPLYKKIEARLTPWQARVTKRSLYYTSNNLRKTYNLFASNGLGLPLPAIKTQQDTARAVDGKISQEFENTYWNSINKQMEKFPALKKTQKISRKGYEVFVLAIASLFAIHTAGNVATMAQTQDVILDPESSLMSSLPLKNDQIQVLNETVPFPHIAIRIGNMVYSHGVHHLSQTPVDEYMQSERLKENAPAKGLLGISQKLGVLKRNIDTVILNLDEKTVLGIRDQLLKETNKEYNNKTFVNSCASMTVRVLVSQGVDINQGVLDASPSILLSYLSLEALAGRKNKEGLPLVAGIYTLQYTKNRNPENHSFRNLVIRQIEAAVQLQLYSLPLNMLERTQIDHEYKDISDFYIDNPERQKALEKIKATAEADLHMLLEYDFYSLKKQTLTNQKASATEFESLRQEFMPEFTKMIQLIRQSQRDPGISFVDYNLNQFKIEFLTAAIAEEK